ncbi:class I SAM-dependent methyltransferase [Cyanobium gracile UHCC 0139]|uniref:Class I SAM-dependent methyltransferase n=1 Tax=Cyanobium gracile UHCC 0139 TaxID=3110308 RepID=A0ABU5RPH7_9CYAN|nr:class I SAM-dependent methyltransferase [Cyanobium gracile]MEA5389756.1 class I SAM-dependent methyltransferase [Cyanobium gracile UHCC 0139]
MSDSQIRFVDGAGYERFMGQWSQRAGDVFLDWLAPPGGQRWLDVGCGNGAFTERLAARGAPAALTGIDPSEEQLAYARLRPALQAAAFFQADAMALPFADNAFDAAVMPLVIFFVPDPATGVAEMARVVRPGGLVAAYGWDMLGGFPYREWREELQAIGAAMPMPPSVEASQMENLLALWNGAGLIGLETRKITVERTFVDFDDYWATLLLGPSVAGLLATLEPAALARIEERLRRRLPTDGDGRLTRSARAHAIRGRVPVATD